MFIPGQEVNWVTKHCIAGIAYVAMPIIYSLYNPNRFLNFLKEMLKWTKDDIQWLRAAPNYYFGSSADKMPPQGHINTGQKLWQLVIIVTGCVLATTGTVMWVFKSEISINTYQRVLQIHDLVFIIVGVMLLVHIYMSVFYPGNGESLRSMLDGKVSPQYAKSHYRKWYDKIAGN